MKLKDELFFDWQIEKKRKSKRPESVKDESIKEIRKKQTCEIFTNRKKDARKDTLNSKITIQLD